MQTLTQFFFTTTEGISLLLLSLGTPVALTLMSAKNIRPLHVFINGILAVLFAIPAVIAFSRIRQGDGMGALLFILVGAGAGLLALAFLVGTLSTGLMLLAKGDGRSMKLRRGSVRRRPATSVQPLTDQYTHWKQTSRRPNATYQEFLEEAHPRHFPSSVWSLAAAAAALALAAYLILR